MTMKYKTIAYDSAKHILAMPDHYVPIARKAAKATEAGGMVVKEGDRFIIKAGTIYPSNDNKAIGVVLQDYDVTESDASMVYCFTWIYSSRSFTYSAIRCST